MTFMVNAIFFIVIDTVMVTVVITCGANYKTCHDRKPEMHDVHVCIGLLSHR